MAGQHPAGLGGSRRESALPSFVDHSISFAAIPVEWVCGSVECSIYSGCAGQMRVALVIHELMYQGASRRSLMTISDYLIARWGMESSNPSSNLR